jgi:tetratricopeptide (TPR) repeat protein
MKEMSGSAERAYQHLMSISTLQGIDADEAIRCIERLIDISKDLERDAGREHALRLCDEIETRLTSSERALVDYFRANVWAERHDAKRRSGAAAWGWEQPDLEKNILFLRRALREPELSAMGPERQCQIWTDLANTFSTIGRIVEAVEYWTHALGRQPHFGMALGNRGTGLYYYARILYDRGDAAMFLRSADCDLAAALSPANCATIHASARKTFEETHRKIKRLLSSVRTERKIDPDAHSLGRSKAEQQYRRWCLRNRLFLNPLNDLGPHSFSACDIVFLPSHRADLEAQPTFVSFFNQLKQEFASARFLFYDGITSDKLHFSDRHVRLLDTLDYPIHSLAEEKVRLSFRAAYSIFDKIAVFLNGYLALGINPKRVNFRTLWYEQKQKREPWRLRARFEQYANWPLRGLFWLAKDLAADGPDMREAIEPEARDLQLVRNHLEHKYLALHEFGPKAASGDDITYAISRKAFESKTLGVLKLARAALTYLSLGMHAEERLRRKQSKSDAVIVPIELPPILDRFKRRF